MTITAPVIVLDMPDSVYRADPVPGGSLSSTGARKILPPSCPALFRWEQQHGRPDTNAFDLGHAAHKLVLGAGLPVAVWDGPDWRTKNSQQFRRNARAQGETPLLTAQWQQIEDMAAQIRAHPTAGKLLQPGSGQAEVSLFWQDDLTEVWCRARYDWLRDHGKRVVVADYKTTGSRASAGEFANSAAYYGYHQQNAFYLAGARALLGDDDPAFIFIVQEKTPPYLVGVFEFCRDDILVGDHLNRQAIDLYRQCVAENTWPSYAPDDSTIQAIHLPAWYMRQHETILLDTP